MRSLPLLIMFALATSLHTAGAQPLPQFDFTKPHGVEGWQPAHDIARLQASPQGMVLEINGPDPYAMGPARDFPADTLLWLHVRLQSAAAGTAQIFYFKDAPSEANSVRFAVQAGDWQEARVPLPALGPSYRLRIDPPGTRGKVTIAALRFAPRILFKEPEWPRPATPVP
jgi:hypothetical protein